MLLQESLEISGGSSNQLLQQGQDQGITEIQTVHECAIHLLNCAIHVLHANSKIVNNSENGIPVNKIKQNKEEATAESYQ